MKVNKEEFLKLFHIGSGSHREQKMIEYVESVLTKNTIAYHKDVNGNIFYFGYKGQPFVSAHMDTVQSENDEKVAKLIKIYDDNIIRGYGVIGGDDKCGVYICLELIKKYKGKLNFSFSVEEEVGGAKGASVIASRNVLELKEAAYGLIFDRRGNSDIICYKNDYGSKLFDEALEEVGKDFGYKSERGLSSDADKFKTYVSCANIASGYYSPHTSSEYVIISDVENALNYGDKIIEKLGNKRFAPCEKKAVTTYYGRGYNRSVYGYDYYDDDYYGGLGGFNNNDTKKKKKIKIEDPVFIEEEKDDDTTLITNCDLCNKYTKTVMLIDSNLCVCEKCMGHLLDDMKSLMFGV